MKPIIKLENVEMSFKGEVILSNVNCLIDKGEIIGLVGPNGSGKSVLFKLICGLYKADYGSIYIYDKLLGSKGFDFPNDMGILIDSPGFIDVYTGFENLRYLANIQRKIDDKKICETMELLGLDSNNKKKVKNYSLGMKQKLGICQAIMEDQDIIILDEPFNALDDSSSKLLKDLLLNLKKQGKTILLTSHNKLDITELCDRVYKIDNRTLHIDKNHN